ncbi:aldehyde dehydrogenase (ALDH) [Monocercomonoides exilis]|uniref:aldehyde dehydrogenase (ALDH) n=1 Tax=Monocercomonoides exilis TaxID=2049356 RepID=UPI00355A2854|nr:aldehyde dehydrogenase (ALDH) [Monocercomonoides exilis]|eukprot:MONOS_3416.1-p1 / transcript=MONOS_3416.1 / gene=MONOS_3416 / organism=Monocercomonoides_exilis_PA203 / gene_product=aldehyde dehydrogenase (ALDH) / transcript_product=aldehyde dehydrogenase (ALDH) / location=Mono_scaffold00080:93116-94846(-) / protein_length=577 / sequence_SO=supercontig / SO=protein_coding / is_pseudo=false
METETQIGSCSAFGKTTLNINEPLGGLTRLQQRALHKEAASRFYIKLDDVPEIHKRMINSFKSGITLSYEWRMAQLDALQRMIKDHDAEFVSALKADLGKSVVYTYNFELNSIICEVQEAKNSLEKWMATKQVTIPVDQDGHYAKGFLQPEPLGVTLIISPWNYPLMLTLEPLVGAIAAGCCACMKPSSEVHNTTHLLATLVEEYLDTRCFKVIEGGRDISNALLELQWDLLFFTGSGNVGRQMFIHAAEHLRPAILELGGKSPAIVDRKADLDLAVKRIVVGKFMNAGQTCLAPDYVFVPDNMMEEFVERVKKTIAEFYGDDLQKSEDTGRIIGERQWSRLAKYLHEDEDTNEKEDDVSCHSSQEHLPSPVVSSSSSSSSSAHSSASSTCACPALRLNLPSSLLPSPFGGHRILLGGKVDKDDLYISPTVISVSTTSSSRFMKEEIFGPILPIVPLPADTFLEDAVAFIKTRDHPLAIYVFTEDEDVKNFVAQSTSSGSITFNDCVVQASAKVLPFGGVGASGIGVYHHKYSFDCFSHTKTVLDRSTVPDPPERFPPYDHLTLPRLRELANRAHA